MRVKVMNENILYYGDNLDILKRYIPDESVDLIYLDPPFKSGQDYNVLFTEQNGTRSTAQIKAFEDTWHWDMASAQAYQDTVQLGGKVSQVMQAFRTFLGTNDMLAYLSMMAPRLVELRRVLKHTGSLFLHCDPTANHYLKLLLDAIFDHGNFRNEIIWRRTGAHGAKRSFAPIHDTILFYTKTSDYYFKEVKKPYMKGHVETRYRKDALGKYRFTSGGNILTGAGATKGESGKAWRGFDPSSKNRHWAIPRYLTKQMSPEFKRLSVLEKLERLYQKGLIEIKEGLAWPIPVRYLEPDDGQPLPDIWAAQPYTEGTVFGTDDIIDADVAWLGTTDPERLGYPTQKPLGLLERIIRSACHKDGIVLDPFCGCGTTIAVAQKLKRKWIGIDITYLAVSLIKHRLKDAFGTNVKYRVVGEPVTLSEAKALATQDPFQFQWWALGLVGARPIEQKRGADKGIDGRLYFFETITKKAKAKQIIFSVKSGKVSVSQIRDLRGVVEREKATIGVFITLEPPTKPMKKEVASAGFYTSQELMHNRYPKIQILTIKELLEGKGVQYPYFGRHMGNVTFKKAPKAE
ncbi:MAG: restriction endonuclease [Candidatus Bathyarchaeota archaeon]|nr:MAG: restriction endonuclease [Candidatus Bathyarchaeota archaeon]